MRLEVAGGEKASASDRDQKLLAGYHAEGLAEDLRIFAEWHQALGTDPNAALVKMRGRLDER